MICAIFVGHRWTDGDKAIALGVFFRSRQAYAILERVFIMPSVGTLNNFVRGIPTVVGAPDSILQLLEVKSNALGADSRYCIITFDEMSFKG